MESDTAATYRKFNCMREAIAHLRVRDKRSIFLLMRTAEELTTDTFFPSMGFTAGEFAVGQVLSENNRKSTTPPTLQNSGIRSIMQQKKRPGAKKKTGEA